MKKLLYCFSATAAIVVTIILQILHNNQEKKLQGKKYEIKNFECINEESEKDKTSIEKIQSDNTIAVNKEFYEAYKEKTAEKSQNSKQENKDFWLTLQDYTECFSDGLFAEQALLLTRQDYATSNPLLKKIRHFTDKKQEETEKVAVNDDDLPYQLWRQILVRNDNSLQLKLILLNNAEMEQASNALIIVQKIPEGWNLTKAMPDIQHFDQERKEAKWLFNEKEGINCLLLDMEFTQETEISKNIEPFRLEHSSYRYKTAEMQLLEFCCQEL